MPNIDLTRRDHMNIFKRATSDDHDFRLQPLRPLILEVEDEHFHHDSAVLLPNYSTENRTKADSSSLGLSVIAQCLKHQSAHPAQTVLVAGHADTSGPDQYNVGISVLRAKAVLYTITEEREAWIAIANGKHKTEDYQLILTWIADVYGWDCDPNGVDNIDGPDTQAAVKNFRTTYNKEFQANIATTGAVGHDTWGAIFDVYMDVVQCLCETDQAGFEELRSKMNFLEPKVVGCGENWPIEAPKKNDYRSQINRRVEILFFDPGLEPKLDCHPGGSACTPILCEVYNLKMYQFTPIPVPPSPLLLRQVFLKLTYLGPESEEHAFPPDFPVTVVWKDKSQHVAKVQQNGLLQFGIPQDQGPFSLQFDTGGTYIATASPGAAAAKPDRTANDSDLKNMHKDSFRHFKVPNSWTLQQSDWKTDSAAHFDATNFTFSLPAGKFGNTLGSSLAPESIQLDPHWTFVRFEFFDRFFGHSDHDHKRINIPATLIDGWQNSPASPTPDTRSHWTVSDSDNAKSVHAIPWIIQFDASHSPQPKPDKDIQFGFETDASTFLISDSATARKIDTVTDAKKLQASADRLKLYDLPKKWKSQKYYTRFSDGKGEFFDKASTFEDKIKASKDASAPLTFSLDDIVLTDQAKQQVSLTANDKVAIFYHKFSKSAEAGKTSDVGIYNFDDGNTASYQTNLDMTGKFYIQDYPNWVRLIIGQQNMWELFSERTEEGGSNQVIGARAAVRWIDSPATGPAAPAAPPPPPAPINMAVGSLSKKDFCAIQPFYEERYSLTSSKYTGPGTIQQGIGRYDMALLRCCDHEGDVEVTVTLHYLRLLFNFTGTPAASKTQPQYIDEACTNVAARWNGTETGANAQNSVRVQILPQADTDKIKSYVVWFLQPVPSTLPNPNRRAHFLINVTATSGRAFMASNKGYGEFGNNCNAPEGTYSPGSYTGAHEVGHGNSLPDEYCERWMACSWGELSFWCRLPGDPYDADGRIDPGAGALTQQDSGMMNGVVKMRNRYFWHSAEFARKATGIALKVKYDAYEDYKVPPHPNAPAQQFTYWPISDAVDFMQGPRGKSDVLAYSMGKDRYTCDILPHASIASPFDGVLVVVVKMMFQINFASLSATLGVNQILPVLRGIVGSTLNNKFMATGKVRTGTPQEWEFKKCQIRFSPRFAVSSPPDPTEATFASDLALVQGIGSHFTVQLNHSTSPHTNWNSATGNILTLEADLTKANWRAILQSQFRDRFAEMVGFANAAAMTKASLKPVVQKVITSNGDVADIT